MATLESFAQHWAQWMVAMTVQLAILIAVLIVLDGWLRRRSAAVRYGMWSLVLLRLVMPPTFALPTGWGWWVLEPRVAAESTASPIPSDSRGARSQGAIAIAKQPPVTTEIPETTGTPETPADPPTQPMLESGVAVAVDSDPRSPTGASRADTSASVASTRRDEVVRSSAGRSWGGRMRASGAAIVSAGNAARHWIDQWAVVLLLVYLGSVCAQLGMLLSSAVQVRSWTRRASLILDTEVQALFDECRERVGLSRMVELRNSESCTTPLVVGVIHPVVLIPGATLSNLDRKELETVLTHELQHIRRRDGLVNVLQSLIGVAYFFHPLVWLANAKLRVIREDVCDELTLHTISCEAKHYAEALIKVAETLGYAAPPLAMGMFDGESPLKKRVVRILAPETARHDPWTLGAIVAPLIAAFVLLPCAARPGSPEPPQASAIAPSPKGDARPPLEVANAPAKSARPPLEVANAPARAADTSEAAPLQPTESDQADALDGAAPNGGQQPVLGAADDPSDERASGQRAGKPMPRRWLEGHTAPQLPLAYNVQLEVHADGVKQQLSFEMTYQWLLTNDQGMVAMARPRNVAGQIDRQAPAWWRSNAGNLFGKAHAQGWSRQGEPQAGDGTDLPLAERSFASLLLPRLLAPNSNKQGAAPSKVTTSAPVTWASLNRPPAPSSPFPEIPGAPPFPSGFRPPFAPVSPFSPFAQAERYRYSTLTVTTEQGIAETVLVWRGDEEMPFIQGTVESTVDPRWNLPRETNVSFTGPSESMSIRFRLAD